MTQQLEIRLPELEDTLAFGKRLADALSEISPMPTVMLEGGLGAGKTTFVRGLVSSLPGADNAEVASPSFNIYNVYPTIPEVAHFDLYRLEGAEPDDELFDFMADPYTLVLVEWSQYLDRKDWPDEVLHLEWSDERDGRLITIKAIGKLATETLKSL